QHQTLGNQAPGAAIIAGGAIVAQAEIMPRLDIERLGLHFLERAPFIGVRPISGSEGYVAIPADVLRIVGVAPEPDAADVHRVSLGAHARRLQVVILVGPASAGQLGLAALFARATHFRSRR